MDNKKSLVALALVALVGIIGGTFAYFTSSATLTNEFTTGTYSTSVTEEFVSPSNWTPGTTTTKKVNVTNNGNVAVAVRAKYTEKWLAADNATVLSGTRNGEQVAQFAIGSDWELATDGYYYYKVILETNQTSSDFISSVTFNPNFKLEEGTDISCTTTTENGTTTVNCANLTTGYAGATYSLDITLETIQADKKWDYTVVNDTPTISYEPGEQLKVAGEEFYVIKDNGDTVTMLAKYNLDSTYRQGRPGSMVTFSNSSGWTYQPGPKEIDIQAYDGQVKTYVNNYVAYLQGETGDSTLTGTLITLSQLKELGCTIDDNYYFEDELTCPNSEHRWLLLSEAWWTRSADSSGDGMVWLLNFSGVLASEYIGGEAGVRPVITISKSAI